jgi:hypothetical protein
MLRAELPGQLLDRHRLLALGEVVEHAHRPANRPKQFRHFSI